jgi:mRNA interferase RelE/StbE
MYRVCFSDRAQQRDVPKIDPTVRAELAYAVQEKLATAPEVFGKPLRHKLRRYRVLRVGDWRIVFQVRGNTVCVLAIRHRREGYANLA